MSRSLTLFLTLALASCGPPEVELTVISPDPGEVFVQGVPVLLDVAATADELPFEPQPTWSTTDWSADGNGIEVTDLPLGDHDLMVTVEHEGGTGSATVAITIEEPPLDPIDYAGVLDMDIEIESPFYNGTNECPSEYLDLTVDPDGTLTGEGACTAPIVGTTVFDVEGLVAGNNVSGVMTVRGGEGGRTLEFTGARDGGTISASYDETFTDGEGTMRLYGTWTATAVSE